MSDVRTGGSAEEFDEDWREALRDGGGRWLVYPDRAADDQVSLAEWVKAQQVLAVLRGHGRSTGRVLEYGCGAAGMSIYLRRRGYECVALDRSPLALAIAGLNQRRRDPLGQPLTRVVADVRALPFRDGGFDIVMSYGLLEHFSEPELAGILRESARALPPGGVFTADVVPGRVNVRTIGVLVSFAASALYHVARGRWRRLGQLREAYFHHYYENALGPDAWHRLLAEAALTDVRVQVCRPFPPLAVSGLLERCYVRLTRWCLPAWRRFDESTTPIVRAWGWMYLCSGVKTGQTAAA